MGSELVMAWDANVSLTSGVQGARRWPALRSSNCMAAKQKYEAISATTAGATHHQSKCRKTVLKPLSSDLFEESTHTASTTRPKPMTTRAAGHTLRTARRTRRRPGLDGALAVPSAVPLAV